MRIIVLAVGRLKSGPERELVSRYLQRAEATGRGVGVSGVQVVEIPEARGQTADDRRQADAAQLLARLPEDARLVLLDETGEDATSEGLARQLQGAADSGVRDVAFAIGGPDGHGAAIRARAERSLRFGRMTWPHQIVRVMLLEQVYRATTIMAGHPYHRA